MKHRGRKSTAELTVANAAIHLAQRPSPPAELTDLQRLHWVQIVNALPVDWFSDENRALLAGYVKTLATLDYLDQQVSELEEQPTIGPIYIELLKRREAQLRLALTHATKMRLTQQSRYRADAAAVKATFPKMKGRTWE